MTLADRKKESNIAEYLLHMFQTEDLMRSYEFDIARVTKDLISLLPLDDEAKIAEADWYRQIIEQMRNEGIDAHGHLASVQEIIAKMELLFEKLKIEDDEFQQLVDAAQPLFDQSSLSETMTCLNGMYAYLILKTDDLPIPEITAIRADVFGRVLSYLSYRFKQEAYLTDN